MLCYLMTAVICTHFNIHVSINIRHSVTSSVKFLDDTLGLITTVAETVGYSTG